MTELLHPVLIDPFSTIAPAQSGDALPLKGRSSSFRASAAHTTPHLPSSDLLGEELSSGHLITLSTRQLRVMVNQAYDLLDQDYPPAGAVERYEMIVEELDDRARQAVGRAPDRQIKETFRDNPLYCRFELFVDGTLAAYLKYTLHGGQIVLLVGVERPAFQGQGFNETLMRHIILNAHKRRLSLIPQCPMALSFLADHPEYQTLADQLRH